MTAEKLIEYVSRHYGTQNFEALLEHALDCEFVVDETRRHAYKYALGHFFSTRAKYAKVRVRERDTIPFAPR